MNIECNDRFRSAKRQGSSRSDAAPSGVAILAFFTIIAVVCVGGYFLLLKLIEISRQEDTGRRMNGRDGFTDEAHLYSTIGAVIARGGHAAMRHWGDPVGHPVRVRTTPVRRIRVLAPPSLPHVEAVSRKLAEIGLDAHSRPLPATDTDECRLQLRQHFFDPVYHLNDVGTAVNSVITDLPARLSARSSCGRPIWSRCPSNVSNRSRHCGLFGSLQPPLMNNV